MVDTNDFVEIKFTGKVKEGEIFDTNIKEDAEKINLKIDEKPLIICISHDMLVKGFDNALKSKEIGKEYSIELSPDDAFKQRKRELIRLMPKSAFTSKNINPVQGMTLALDNTLVRIISVSGGRVLVDFNNPLAGKTIIYDFKITRKVDNLNEKINSLIDFFLHQKVEYEIDNKNNKIILKLPEFYNNIITELNKKFKNILGKEFVIEPEKTDKKIKNKEKSDSK